MCVVGLAEGHVIPLLQLRDPLPLPACLPACCCMQTLAAATGRNDILSDETRAILGRTGLLEVQVRRGWGLMVRGNRYVL